MFGVNRASVQNNQVPSDTKPIPARLIAVLVAALAGNSGQIAGELDIAPLELDGLAEQFLKEEVAPLRRISQAARLRERLGRTAVLCVTSRVRHRHRGWIPG